MCGRGVAMEVGVATSLLNEGGGGVSTLTTWSPAGKGWRDVSSGDGGAPPRHTSTQRVPAFTLHGGRSTL